MINELELEEQQQQLDLATVLEAFLSTDHPTNSIIILNIKKDSGKCGARQQEKNIFNAFSIFWESKDYKK